MKIRILVYGISADHQSITILQTINDPLSISDFDVFVIDPDHLCRDQHSFQDFQRRRAELSELVNQKGGIVICMLRPSAAINAQPQAYLTYMLFDGVIPAHKLSLLNNFVRPGAGTSLKIHSSARGPSSAFFQTLQGNLDLQHS